MQFLREDFDTDYAVIVEHTASEGSLSSNTDYPSSYNLYLQRRWSLPPLLTRQEWRTQGSSDGLVVD